MVIAADGTHYRLQPNKPNVIQVQDKQPPYHWLRHVTCQATPDATASEVAVAWLQMLGKLQPGGGDA